MILTEKTLEFENPLFNSYYSWFQLFTIPVMSTESRLDAYVVTNSQNE